MSTARKLDYIDQETVKELIEQNNKTTKLKIVEHQRDTERIFSKDFSDLKNQINKIEKQLTIGIITLIGILLGHFYWTDGKFDDVNTRINDKFDDVNTRINDQFNGVNARLDRVNARIDKFSEARILEMSTKSHRNIIDRNEQTNINEIKSVLEQSKGKINKK